MRLRVASEKGRVAEAVSGSRMRLSVLGQAKEGGVMKRKICTHSECKRKFWTRKPHRVKCWKHNRVPR